MKLKQLLRKIDIMYKDKKLTIKKVTFLKKYLPVIWGYEFTNHHVTGNRNCKENNPIRVRSWFHSLLHTKAYEFIVSKGKDFLLEYVRWIEKSVHVKIRGIKKDIKKHYKEQLNDKQI